MNEAEIRAYGLVAQAIAKHAFAMAEHNKEDGGGFPNAPRPIYYHYSTSTFEAVARDLWRLSILRPLDLRGDWAFHFAFDCEVGKSNIVAERNWPHGPTLFDLLVTFINLFGDFGAEYWGYYHYSTSTFEAVARDLWRLSILRPLDLRGDWAFHFAFDCEVGKSNIVAERNWPHGPTLFDLLVTFINLFGDFGAEYWGFSAKPNNPFV